MPEPGRLWCDALRISVGRRTLVEDATLSLRAGEGLALVGASGAGKSVLARALAGLLSPDASIAGRRGVEGPGRVVYLPQLAEAALDPLLTVGQQLRACGLAREPAVAALDRVGLRETASLLGRYPGALSGGMARRVLVAMALARNAAFLLADEPTTGLDPRAQEGLLALLAALRPQGVGLLLITHDLRQSSRCCDRVAVMAAGRIVETLEATAIRGATSPEARALLTATARLPGAW